jgi:hypothetical protein
MLDIDRSMCEQDEARILELEKMAQENGKALAVEVVADNSGKFCGNGLRFETAEQAVQYANDLAGRWFLVTKYQVVIADKKEQPA